MDSESGVDSPRPLESHPGVEITSEERSVDPNTQSGLEYPPAKRAKMPTPPELFPPPSSPYQLLQGSDVVSSDAESDSRDSFILDLLGAENSGEADPGISFSIKIAMISKQS